MVRIHDRPSPESPVNLGTTATNSDIRRESHQQPRRDLRPGVADVPSPHNNRARSQDGRVTRAACIHRCRAVPVEYEGLSFGPSSLPSSRTAHRPDIPSPCRRDSQTEMHCRRVCILIVPMSFHPTTGWPDGSFRRRHPREALIPTHSRPSRPRRPPALFSSRLRGRARRTSPTWLRSNSSGLRPTYDAPSFPQIQTSPVPGNASH